MVKSCFICKRSGIQISSKDRTKKFFWDACLDQNRVCLFLDEDEDEDLGGDAEDRPLESSPDKADGPDASKSSSFLLGQNWRDLIPVIKIDVVTFANLFVFEIDLYDMPV